MAIEVGDKYFTKDTVTNRHCGVPPDKEVRVTFVEEEYISVWCWCHHRGEIKGRVKRSQFGMLFSQDPYAPINKTYAEDEPFESIYPDDFLHKG